MKKIICNLCGYDDYSTVCYGKDRLLNTDDNKFRVVKCKNCGLVYLNPQPSPDELSKYYPDHYGSYIEKEVFKYSKLVQLIKIIVKRKSNKIMKKQLPSKTENNDCKKYLDFGCGGSRNLENVKLAHPSWEMYGLDNNKLVCKQIEEKGFKIFCGDVADITLPNNFFDYINMSSVIEHVYDPKYTMMKLYESLKLKGVVKIRTPNYNSFARFLFGKYWVFIDSPRHLYLFSMETLTKLLSDTGFEIEKIEFLPNPYAEIKSLYYLINKKDRRMSPITWRILSPFTYILSKLGMSSTIIITARKFN